jgi:hypothetical protein
VYLVHFAVAAWAHYALLGWSADAIVKGTVVFAVTLATSWTLASVLRRLPGLSAVL